MHGYSGTPLAKKLGIGDGFRVRTSNAPENYQACIRHRFASEVRQVFVRTANFPIERNTIVYFRGRKMRCADKQQVSARAIGDGCRLALVSPLPGGVTISNRITRKIDIWHMFTRSYSDLESKLPVVMQAMPANGVIWISWPKKASGVPSTVTEDAIRALALPLGLVDVKVCAIDETWSGLRLVVRKELRKLRSSLQ